MVLVASSDNDVGVGIASVLSADTDVGDADIDGSGDTRVLPVQPGIQISKDCLIGSE